MEHHFTFVRHQHNGWDNEEETSVPGDAHDLNGCGSTPSDCTIVCGDHRFLVHREVICQQSPVFSAGLNGQWMESITSTYTIKDVSWAIINRMIDFMYNGRYSGQLDDEETRTGVNELIIHAEMYGMADRFMIQPLRLVAFTAYQSKLGRIKSPEDFLISVPFVFNLSSETCGGLRNLAIDYAKATLRSYIRYDTEGNLLYHEIIKECPEFTQDLLTSCFEDSMGIPDEPAWNVQNTSVVPQWATHWAS